MQLISFFIFLLGAAVGSFLNVLADRLPRQKSIGGRSQCDHCGRILEWRDLMPVWSFFVLRGRCRTCRGRISWQYPITEISTGLIFLLIFNFQLPIFSEISNADFSFLPVLNLIYYLFIASCLIAIFIADLKYYIIPDKIVWPAIWISLFYRFFEIYNFKIWNLFGHRSSVIGHFLPYLLAGLGAAAFFVAIVAITRGNGMGWGDVKLAFLLGLFLGWPLILWSMFLAFFAGASVGVFLIVLGRKTMKSQIPFGPFLAGAALLIFIFAGFFPFLL